MGRKEIEEKDQDLLKDIREIVRRNEEKTTENKSFFQSMRFWLPVLVVIAIITGTMVFNKPPTSSAPDSTEQASGESADKNTWAESEKSTNMTTNGDTNAQAQVEPPVEEKKPAVTRGPIQTEEETSTQLVSIKQPGPVDEEPSTTEGIIIRPEKEKPLSVTDSTTPEQLKKKNDEPIATVSVEPERVEAGAKTRVSKLVSCAGIQNKQYVSQQSVFSLKEISKPVVWMRVLTDKPPFTLTHVYYHNEKKYCEVPLEVKYPHMRTWSYLTLTHPDQTGQYRVEVVTDDGEKLGEIQYTVVP